MRPYLPLAVLLLAVPAFADEASRRFRPGTFATYELKTEFRYQAGYIPNCGNNVPAFTTQTETVTLRTVVTHVGDDGAARLSCTVTAAGTSTWNQRTNTNLSWSSTSGEAPVDGFARWAAMVGHEFTVDLAADGRILALPSPDWPSTAVKTAEGSRSQVEASREMRDPTTKRAWLQMLFGAAPRAGGWKDHWNLPTSEALAFRNDGREQVDGHWCVRVRFESDRKPENPADVTPREREKDGRVWFGEKDLCTVKVEMKGTEDAKLYKEGVLGTVKWSGELKDRGVVDLTKGEGSESTREGTGR